MDWELDLLVKLWQKNWQHFKSIHNLMQATFEELISVDEIGDRIAESVIEFSTNLLNIQLVERLVSYGIQLEISEEVLENQSDKLNTLIFVVSGVFTEFNRNDLKKSIEDNGGKVGSSISKKTSYVIAGENMGPSKLKKAQDLNIPIISELDYLKMIN